MKEKKEKWKIKEIYKVFYLKYINIIIIIS